VQQRLAHPRAAAAGTARLDQADHREDQYKALITAHRPSPELPVNQQASYGKRR